MNLQPPGEILSSPGSTSPIQERAGGKVVVLGLVTGLILTLVFSLLEHAVQAPLLAGPWLGIFASTTWVPGFATFVLIFGAGPAIAYLGLSRIDPVVRSDTGLRDRLLPGTGALSGSYFIVLFFSLVLEWLMPFSPDTGIWVIVQACMTLAIFVGIRIEYSRYYAVPLRWIPGRKELIAVLMIIIFIVIILFLLGNLIMGHPAVFTGAIP
jgi:hypothetical protein